MKGDVKDIIAKVLIGLIIAAAGYFSGDSVGEHRTKREAVRNGHGRLENGRFHWNEERRSHDQPERRQE